ncbi:MAG: NAD-dependent epimerase/dehydratase family protein [Gemmatimonadetes bacterium]|nr:NAD-dependent epimerase/dehydratase family protein [Gemmatimonadota bacterium]
MTSLVTGGAGFIGSHVAELLDAAGEQVVVLDDLSGGFVENIVGQRTQFVQGSVTDAALVNRLFEEHRFDHVYHLAAYAAEGLSHFIRHYNYENNVLGSMNLINASVNHGVKVFVFTSSIAVYGSNQLPMTEELTPRPEDPYGIGKYAVELDLAAAHEMFGLDYVIFRPHNVYGERQNIGDRYRNVIGIFMSQILKGEPMTVFGDGRQTRAFSYIADVAPAIAHCVHRPAAFNQVFNIGADQPYSVLDLAQAVAKALGAEPALRHLEARKEVVHAYSSHDKVRRVLGDLTGNVPLDEGIARMAAWVRMVGARESSRFTRVEVPKNMPRSWAEFSV